MAVFPREVYLHRDPKRVYDCIGWDSQEGKYILKDDFDNRLKVTPSEFTPLSAAKEELIQADGKGGFITVEEQMAHGAGFEFRSSRKPSVISSLNKKSDAASGARKARKPKEGQANGQDDAKAKVKALLDKCEGNRELVAETAGRFLGEDKQGLLEKYQHLDAGRFRMVLGNKMRSKINKQSS